MDISNDYISQLLSRYLEGLATENETRELLTWLKEQKGINHEQFNEVLASSYKQSMESDSPLPAGSGERIFQKLTATINAASENFPAAPVIVLKYRRAKWIAAAAAATGIAIALYLLSPKPISKAGIVSSIDTVTHDIRPGGNKAVLTLSDGKTITLDSLKNGVITGQGGAEIIKPESGELAYTPMGGTSDETFFNTITTPKGGQYHVVLSDGTAVWLNAASSLRYPTSFKGSTRKVVLTGEAYFEVAHNAAMPFVVEKGTSSVTVLGTHFNVNAYDDEQTVSVTLLEGSVKVSSLTADLVIRPGQQALLNPGEKIRLIPDADIENAVAWKNGKIQFRGAAIETVMRQLARWYDVDIEYTKKTDDLFYAEIPRATMLSDVLKALELTGKVHFKIKGRKIIVNA